MTEKYYKDIANETLSILINHKYQVKLSNLKNHKYQINYFTCDLKKSIELTVQNSIYYNEKTPIIYNTNNHVPNYYVLNESSINCVLNHLSSIENIAVLNFASAVKPGGGWLNGRVAQEEDITRKSTLFSSLINKKEFYDNHKLENPFYSNALIYSPHINIIRDDNNILIKPKEISVITSAAINLNDLKKYNCNSVVNQFYSLYKKNLIDEIMVQRIERILQVAIANKQDTIVLGAFGCGVFGHNPEKVALYFNYLLKKRGYEKYFKNIYFAILDTTPNQLNFKTFMKYFN